MYVACSTSCFARYPLDRALRMINDLEFSKVEIVIAEEGAHLKPSDVMKDVSWAVQQIRIGPSLTPSALRLEFDTPDVDEYRRQLQAVCRLARLSMISTITISPAANTTPFEREVARLKPFVQLAEKEGVILALPTWKDCITETPKAAAELCAAVPGLGLALDPSHFIAGPHQSGGFDEVYPYVAQVHLRDTGRRPGQFQVRIGQGQIEYGKIVSHLNLVDYDRLLTVDIHDIPDAPFVMEAEVRKLKFLLESLV